MPNTRNSDGGDDDAHRGKGARNGGVKSPAQHRSKGGGSVSRSESASGGDGGAHRGEIAQNGGLMVYRGNGAGSRQNDARRGDRARNGGRQARGIQ